MTEAETALQKPMMQATRNGLDIPAALAEFNELHPMLTSLSWTDPDATHDRSV